MPSNPSNQTSQLNIEEAGQQLKTDLDHISLCMYDPAALQQKIASAKSLVDKLVRQTQALTDKLVQQTQAQLDQNQNLAEPRTKRL